MKAMQFGDIHAEDGAKFSEIESCLLYIVERAEAEKPDVIINTGDTFNSSEVKLDSKSAKLIFSAFSRLADVAPVVVAIGTPSHDGMAAEVLKHVKGKHRIYVATCPEQVRLECGVIVSTVPAPTKKYMQGADEELAGAMTAIFGGFAASADSIVSNYKIENRPHILVGHWNVAGSKVHGQDYIGHEITIGYDAMMLAQPDLICMGHIHFAQQIKEKLFYNGSIYQKDFGEMEDKGFWLHEFDGKTLTKSTFEQTPHRKLYRDRFDLCAGESIEPSTDGCDSCHVRCEIKVFQDEVDKIDKQIIELIYYDAGAVDVDVRLIRVPRQTVRSELVLNATTLPMKLRAMAILRDETVSATVLLKAEMLENCSPEQISKMVSKGDFIKKENTDAVN